jgi:hypothetical protein
MPTDSTPQWSITEPVEYAETVDVTYRNMSERDAAAMTRWRQYFFVLWDLDQWLRSQAKYNEDLSEESAEVHNKVREQLRELMDDHRISLDDLE